MERKSRPKRIHLVFFLFLCFLVAHTFSSYYELCEDDIFLPNLHLENPSLSTLSSTEKVKSHLSLSYSGFYSGLPSTTAGSKEQIVSSVLTTLTKDQLNSPRRCCQICREPPNTRDEPGILAGSAPCGYPYGNPSPMEIPDDEEISFMKIFTTSGSNCRPACSRIYWRALSLDQAFR